MTERLRPKLWSLLIRLPRVCPANAHTAIVLTYPGWDRSVFTGQACRRDRAACGSCWCGRLRQDPAAALTLLSDLLGDAWQPSTRKPGRHAGGDHLQYGTLIVPVPRGSR